MLFARWLSIICIVSGPALVWSADEGLVAHYPLNAGAGSIAYDVTPGHRNAEIRGAQWVETERGPALELDGVAAYLDCGRAASLRLGEAVTLSLWIKPQGIPPAASEPVLVGEQPRSCALTYYRGRVYFYFGHFSNKLAHPAPPGRWYHIVATAGDGIMRLYLNGELRASRDLPVGARVNFQDRLTIGANPRTPAFFRGLVDDVRIYSHALSAAQVKALSASQLAAMEKSRRQRATRFFESHADAVALQVEEDRLLFANRQLGLEFYRSTVGFKVARLYAIQRHQDLLTPDSADREPNLFQLVTITNRGCKGRMAVSGAWEARATSFRRSGDRRAATLHLEWRWLNAGSDEGVLDVEVAVTLKEGDLLAHWRINVRNRSSRYGLWRVYFPVLNLAPVGEAADNVFIFPQDRGRLVVNPFAQPPGYGDSVHRSGRYPAAFGMQFQALYNRRTGAGVYLGTQDPVPHLKNTESPNYATHITWKPGHFPPNMGYPGEDYRLPYDCVVGPFDGDWWDACQIYRRWAKRQTWSRRGRLEQRADIPRWYKEAPLFLVAKSHCRDAELAAIERDYLRYLRWAGMPLPCQWYAWKSYRTELTAYDLPTSKWRAAKLGFPCSNVHDGNYPKLSALPGFAAMCQRLRPAGGRVLPYVCLQIYDQGPTENAPYADEAKPYVVRDACGAAQTYGSEPSWAMCVWTDWWRRRVRETCLALLRKEHAGGFYLDTMHGAGEPCFATAHGHTACGGSALPLGMHRIAGETRAAVKQIDPETITTGEDSAENMMDVIDGKLYQQTLTPNTAPLFAAVYNDFIPRYGMNVTPDDGDEFFMEAASLFVEGAQMGRIYIGPQRWRTSFDNPQHAECLRFLGRLVGYYRQPAARKFLCYGQLMRPLEFRQPASLPRVSFTVKWGPHKGRRVQRPALFSGVFRTPDGELAAFVVNAGAETVSFAADLHRRRWGLASATRLSLSVTDADGASSAPTATSADPVILAGTLPGRQATMFRLCAASK